MGQNDILQKEKKKGAEGVVKVSFYGLGFFRKASGKHKKRR